MLINKEPNIHTLQGTPGVYQLPQPCLLPLGMDSVEGSDQE